MPSISPTPASLKWTGGDLVIEPIRLSLEAASLACTGGDLETGPNLAVGITKEQVRLDRLQRGQGYFDRNGLPSVQMQALWQRNVESVERAFTSQGDQIDELGQILAAIQEAQNTATQAAQQAQAVSDEVSLANSTTEPVDGLLTANSDGTINIAAHNRKYSNASVAVDAGSVSGFAPGAFVRVYYNDMAREGGTVEYEGTTGEITQGGAVHIVGGVTVPQAGEAPVEGIGTTPPGFIRVISEISF